MHARVAVLVGVVLFFVGTSSSWAQQPSQDEIAPGPESVLEFLVGEEFMPSRLELRLRSGDIVGDLVEIVEGRYPWRVRQRAVRCLSMYREAERALPTFHHLLESMSQSSELFPLVLVGYMEVLGEEGVQAVGPLLEHRSKFVRLGAVVGLGRFGGQQGYELLERRHSEEQDVLVRQQILQYVTPLTQAVAVQ